MLVHETASAVNHTYNYFDIAANCSGLLIVKILDIQGKIAKTIKETLEDGAYKFSVNVDDLKTGKYIINIFNDIGFVKSVRYTKS